MKDQVNHPSHYNSHPNGIECIDIIPRGRDGRVECEVHKRLNRTFRSEVHWERRK